MFVTNHCGTNNTCYTTWHGSVPYSSRLPTSEANVSVEFQLRHIRWGEVAEHSLEESRDHITGNVVECHWKQRDLVLSMSHAVTITDGYGKQSTIFFDDQGMYRNWVIVFLPTGQYTQFNSPVVSKLRKWMVGNPVGNRGSSDRSEASPGEERWGVYYGCHVCGAYTSQPWDRKLTLPGNWDINGSKRLYWMWVPRYKCQECHTWVYEGSRATGPTRLGKSDIVIFCRFDQIKWIYC